MDILITDKTGTLTDGDITLVDAIDPAGRHCEAVTRLGLLFTDTDLTMARESAATRFAAMTIIYLGLVELTSACRQHSRDRWPPARSHSPHQLLSSTLFPRRRDR